MRTITYWLVVVALLALAVASFRLMVTHGMSGMGIAGLVGTLISVAVLLSYALSKRDADRSPPIAR